jgi:hypothetical protein
VPKAIDTDFALLIRSLALQSICIPMELGFEDYPCMIQVGLHQGPISRLSDRHIGETLVRAATQFIQYVIGDPS